MRRCKSTAPLVSNGMVSIEQKEMKIVDDVSNRAVRSLMAQVTAWESPSKEAMRESYLADEAYQNRVNARLAKKYVVDNGLSQKLINQEAQRLVEACRSEKAAINPVQQLLHEYKLSSREGVTLLALAEALLRVRSPEGRSRLIADKLDGAAHDLSWTKGHIGISKPVVVNAAASALAAGEIVVQHQSDTSALGRLVQRLGKDAVRICVVALMRKLGNEFVLGENIHQAMRRAQKDENKGIVHSYDMLGEAARTQDDANKYFAAYIAALEALASHSSSSGRQLSVKLSALDPRFEASRRAELVNPSSQLVCRTIDLCQRAADLGDIQVTIDAEEASRLELQLDILANVSTAMKSLRPEWDGLGLAVQAYQKRAVPVIDWLAQLARRDQRTLGVRLVKGAYWDSEIKLAQLAGLSSFPVFTRKEATDVSYEACAGKLILEYGDCLRPAFATHNARTLAYVTALHKAAYGDNMKMLELQRLHGMGQQLHNSVATDNVVTRVYAPVGSHDELLAYLVRRLLENGANSSFVNAVADPNVPVEHLATDPVATLANEFKYAPHPLIKSPSALFSQNKRTNSAGIDLFSDYMAARDFVQDASAFSHETAVATFTESSSEHIAPVIDPATEERCGAVQPATVDDVHLAINIAQAAQPAWCALGPKRRAAMLQKAADLMEARLGGLASLLVVEAGKTWPDALSEIREAIDFLRYYAKCALEQLDTHELPGAVGERNIMTYRGRGIWAAIAPFNFPLAIFCGQVAAPLVAGNAVVAKSAPQTPLAGAAVMDILHQAGVPKEVCSHLPGGGAAIGQALVSHDAIAGVVFTGSSATAREIFKSLALNTHGPLPQLIAETAGLNALIADESALPEQLVADVVRGSFGSAGQRCSSTRLLFVPEQTADTVLPMLRGAVEQLRVGDPSDFTTDIGPLIDQNAKKNVATHVDTLLARDGVSLLAQTPGLRTGNFFPPTVLSLSDLSLLPRNECFGPILHVVLYDARTDNALTHVVNQVNSLGFGLTMGLHSRLDSAHEIVTKATRAGNLYINRDTIGAVVESQPFGGTGLSGTGPKAGGPDYVRRFAVEHVVSTNTAASGGDYELMSQI